MDCNDVKNIMAEYVQGDLSTAGADSIRRHIESCPACSREHEAFVKSWELLDDWKDVEPSSDFNARFWSLADAQENAGMVKHPSPMEKFLSSFLSLFTFRVPAWSVAVLLIAAIYLGHFLYPPQVVEVERVVYKEVPMVQVADLNISTAGSVQSSSDYLPSPYSVLKSSQEQETPIEEEIFEQNNKSDGGIERLDIEEFMPRSGS